MNSKTKIASREELNAAVGELARLNAQAKRIDAECDAAIKRLKDEAAEKKVHYVDEVPFSIEEWCKILNERIELYCENNRDELLADGEKSVRLTHGVIGWRKAKDYVEPLNKRPEKWWLQKIIDFTIEKILKAVNTFSPDETDIKAADLVKVDLKWDKAAMLKGVSDGRMKPNHLKPFGFAFREGSDEFYITLDEATVEGKKPG